VPPRDTGAVQGGASARSPAAGSIKGAALRPLVEWYVARGERARLLEAVQALPAEWRELIDAADAHLGFLPSRWYPASLAGAILDQLTAGVPRDQLTARARDGARRVMRATLRGVYKLLFDAMMTPERYARHAHLLFSRYYDTGTLEKTVLAPNRHRTAIRDWSGHHPFLCELMVYIGEFVYDAIGCQDLVIERTGCVSDGAPECTFLASWSAVR
jgi:hypothetical protein